MKILSLLRRLVAEINSERKLKSQKAKPKSSEGRMHLSNVRVIQRNLVYIIGLPLNLADEAVSDTLSLVAIVSCICFTFLSDVYFQVSNQDIFSLIAISFSREESTLDSMGRC